MLGAALKKAFIILHLFRAQKAITRISCYRFVTIPHWHHRCLSLTRFLDSRDRSDVAPDVRPLLIVSQLDVTVYPILGHGELEISGC